MSSSSSNQAGESSSSSSSSSAFKKSAIYTRTGDDGTTSLYNMSRSAKTEAEFDALGDVDELNSHIGLAAEHLSTQLSSLQLKPSSSSIDSSSSSTSSVGDSQGRSTTLMQSMLTHLADIQSRLFDIGSHIATPLNSSDSSLIDRMSFAQSHVDRLERLIDEYEHGLARLTHFILPSGGLCSTQLHVCRTVCRRAERKVLKLNECKHGVIDLVIARYLNRLSDLLFVFARRAAFHAQRKETLWIKA